MMKQQQQQQNMILQRSASTSTTTTRKNNKNNNNRRSTSNIPSNFQPSESNDDYSQNQNFLIKRGLSLSPSFSSNQQNTTNNNQTTTTKKLSSLIRSFLNIFTFQTIIPTCNWLTLPTTLSPKNFPPTSRKLTGTLFGHRHGHVSFAVQLHPRASPLLLLQLSMSTSSLVKEMSSGLVRIALECRKPPVATRRRLFNEPDWTMYCNGRKCGYAVTRTCGDLDWHVLSTVQSVSVGAGVIPVLEDGKGGGGGSEGELMYMRARFERVVGSRDSEAFYMLNPDGNGGPELSIFLLRL